MVAGAYGLMLLAVAAGVGLWLLLWHNEGGWLPWVSLAVMAFVSLLGLATITSGVIRTARRDRARRLTS